MRKVNQLRSFLVVVCSALLVLDCRIVLSFSTTANKQNTIRSKFLVSDSAVVPSSSSSIVAVMMSSDPSPEATEEKEEDNDGGDSSDDDALKQQLLLQQLRQQQQEVERLRIQLNQEKSLDPLMRSLTKNDQPVGGGGAGGQSGERTYDFPLLGELSLEKEFALLPVAGFAVLGFLYSFVVAFNARDSFMNAMVQNLETTNERVLIKGSPQETKKKTGDLGCKGLCGSQEQSLQDLQKFYATFQNRED